MSIAHKGSRLILRDQVIAVPFESFHADFNMDATAIQYGDLVCPDPSSVYTIRRFEGKFGGCIAVEESTANLIETVGLASQDWSRWSHWGSSTYWGAGYSQYQDPDMGMVFKGIPSGNTVYLFDYYPYTFTSGGVYTHSIYLRADYELPNQTIYSYINSNAGGQHAISPNVNFTGISTRWRRYVATHVINETVSGNGGIGWCLGALPSGCAIYAAMPQLEQKGFATSFVKGSRNNGLLKYPKEIINTEEGAISFWLYAFGAGYGTDKPVYSIGIDGGFDFLINDSNNPYVRAYTYGGASTQLRPNVNLFNSWNHIVVAWKRNTFLGVYVNGVLLASSSSPVDWADFYNKNATGFYIGSGIRSNPNILISDFRIDKTMPSAEEVSAWYISGKPAYNPFDYRAYSY